jgi:DNA-binding MarR family transcriptional regulator
MRIEDEVKTTNFRHHIQKAHLNIMFTGGWVEQRVHDHLRPFGITVPQYNVLRIVLGQGGKPIKLIDIQERMVDRFSNVTRIVARLAEKDYLTTTESDEDRRVRLAIITPEGTDLLKAIESAWDLDDPHQGHLTPQEAEQLNRLLDKIRSI